MLYKDGGKLAIGTRSAQDLVLSTNDTIRLTITSTGTATFSSSVTANSLLVERTVSRNMLGISSTSLPTSGDEEGVAVIKTNSTIWQLSTVGYAADSKGVRFYNNGGTGYTAFEVAQAGGTRFIVNGAGNVGIGTASPTGSLQVSNGTLGLNLPPHVVNITGNNYTGATIGAYDAASLAANTGGGINFGALYTSTQFTEFAYIRTNKDTATSGEYGGSLIFATRPNGGSLTERMRITSGGNVGIGTASPDRNLEVETGSDTYLRVTGNRGNADELHVGNLEFYNSNTSTLVGEIRGITGTGGTQSNSGQLAFYTNNAGTYAERMRITSAGATEIRSGNILNI
jgi:hypothetical protein